MFQNRFLSSRLVPRMMSHSLPYIRARMRVSKSNLTVSPSIKQKGWRNEGSCFQTLDNAKIYIILDMKAKFHTLSHIQHKICPQQRFVPWS